jgi:hypothetical protein
MAVKRTSHAVYDTKYHLVWTPKDRQWVLRGDLRQRGEELFHAIAQDFGFAIDPGKWRRTTCSSSWISPRATRLRRWWGV